MADPRICSIKGCGKPAMRRGKCDQHYRRDLIDHPHRERCAVPACGRPAKTRGWCQMHYLRWRRHGSPIGGRAPNGEAMQYLTEAVLTYEGSECLIWPYTRDPGGYGRIWDGQQTVLVHHLVCDRTHGLRPSSRHEAAHSCGNGHGGCVNPRHLRWATPTENQRDRVEHGTSNRGERCAAAKLTEADIRLIRSLSLTLSHQEIAEQFGVSRPHIGDIIRGKRWRWLI